MCLGGIALSEKSLKQKVAIGTVWVLLLRFALRGIGLISTMILARILLPEDYGLIALGYSVYTFIEMLAAFGFDMVLVQKAKLERSDYDSAWTARLICYTVLAVVFVGLADVASAFYNEPRLTPIIYVLGVQMFLRGLENMALVDFRRELMFDKEFKYKVSIKIIGFCVTIPLAFYLQNYWALLWGTIVSKVASVALSYYFRPYMPSICFEKTREIMDFSKWLLFTNIAQFFRSQLPNIMLGKYVSSGAVGIYSIGTEIARFSSQELVAAMNRPVYSGFAKLKQNKDELVKNYLEVVGFQAFVVLPMGFGLAATSDYAVRVILGSNWLSVIEPISILAISVALSSISSCCQYIYLVSGKPKLPFTISLFGLAIFAPQVLLFTEKYGLMGVVYAHFVSNTLTAMLNFWMVSRTLQISLQKIVSVLLRPFLGALAMVYVLSYWLMPELLGVVSNPLVGLLIVVPVGAAIYALLTFGFWLAQGKPESPEHLAIRMLREKLLKRFA